MHLSLILVANGIKDAFAELHEYLGLFYILCFPKVIAEVTKKNK